MIYLLPISLPFKSSINMSYKQALSESIILGLEENIFSKGESPNWGIGVSFAENILQLEPYLSNKKWVNKVAKLLFENDSIYPDPQLRIQRCDGEFRVFLECLIGEKYELKYDEPKIEIVTKDELKSLIEWLLSSKFKIYDQWSISIFD